MSQSMVQRKLLDYGEYVIALREDGIAYTFIEWSCWGRPRSDVDTPGLLWRAQPSIVSGPTRRDLLSKQSALGWLYDSGRALPRW